MKQYGYIEWLGADEMHEHSKGWFSELTFIKDEQRFLNDLIKSRALDLLDLERFEETRAYLSDLSNAEKELIDLLKKVQKHGDQLSILVDDVDQPKMEKAYIETHHNLSVLIDKYLFEYRLVKQKIFRLMSLIFKKGKQKRLLKKKQVRS